MFNPETIFPIFIGTWIVLGVISFLLFYVSKNAPLKRKLWPPTVIGTGMLFAAFIYLMGFPTHVFAIMGPAIIVITLINLRTMKFCDSCGRSIANQNPFSKFEYSLNVVQS